MASTFNSQILVEKLAKLNSSQASIETLSHWCIFHMNKAKQVVDTWDRQFHCSPRERRLAFLYLANDILQNSRRKGSEFVGEFWKVLPDALRDVINNGDESARISAQRMIGIWEERKVFGSRGQILKDDLVGKHVENINRPAKHLGTKLKQPVGSALDKITSGYQVVYGGPLDEDVILSKCRNVISSLEKVDKEIGSSLNAGQYPGISFEEELQGQQAILRESIGELTTIESSRASLVSHLREALQEQESKLEYVRNQLQAARTQSEHSDSIYQQLLHPSNVQGVVEEYSVEVNPSIASQSFIPGNREQSAPAMYSQQSFPEKSGHAEEDSRKSAAAVAENSRKSAAAAVAEKLTASTSPAEMLSYVLSSFASEAITGNPVKESSGDYPSAKRNKIENDQPYVPTQNTSQFSLPFQHPQTFQHNITTSTQQPTPNEPPPPRSSPPPPHPTLPAMQQFSVPPYMQAAGSLNGVPYGYISQQQSVSLSGYSPVVPPTGINTFAVAATNSFQGYQGSEGNIYSQAPSMPMAPISRQ